MNRKKIISLGAITFAVTMVAANIFNNCLYTSFATITNNDIWYHYSPRAAGSTELGIREYWIQCGGGYTFKKPTTGTIIDKIGWDTSEFEENDKRYIKHLGYTTGYYYGRDNQYLFASNDTFEAYFSKSATFSFNYKTDLVLTYQELLDYMSENASDFTYDLIIYRDDSMSYETRIDCTDLAYERTTAATYVDSPIYGPLVDISVSCSDDSYVEPVQYSLFNWAHDKNYVSVNTRIDKTTGKKFFIKNTYVYNSSVDLTTVKTIRFGEGVKDATNFHLYNEFVNIQNYVFSKDVELMQYTYEFKKDSFLAFEDKIPAVNDSNYGELTFNYYYPDIYLTQSTYEIFTKYGRYRGCDCYVFGEEKRAWESSMSILEYRQKSALQADSILTFFSNSMTNQLDKQSVLMPFNDSMIEYSEIHDFTVDIIKNATSEYNKYEIIYNWITTNIEYNGGGTYYSPYEAFKAKKGVCSQYAALLHDMLSAAEIPSLYVQVYNSTFEGGSYSDFTIKDVINYQYKSTSLNHALLAVFINNSWFYCDPTFGYYGYNRINMTSAQVVSYGYTFKTCGKISTLPNELSPKYLNDAYSKDQPSGGTSLYYDGVRTRGGFNGISEINGKCIAYIGQHYVYNPIYSYYNYSNKTIPTNHIQILQSIIFDDTFKSQISGADFRTIDLAMFLGFIKYQYGLEEANKYIKNTPFFIGEDNNLYKELNDGTLQFSYNIEERDSLIIPRLYNGKTVSRYSCQFFFSPKIKWHSPKKIYLEEGFTNVLRSSFYSVDELYFPLSITTVDRYALDAIPSTKKYFKGKQEDITLNGMDTTNAYFEYNWTI